MTASEELDLRREIQGMKERPILMSGDNPRLIIEGRKTQTRRIVKPWQPDGETVMHFNYGKAESFRCPYGSAGDRLWVREKWNATSAGLSAKDLTEVFYAATYKGELKWRPSIHMPRWVSRITLEITKVRVERLQDISPGDSRREGRRCGKCSGSPNNIGACCCIEHFAARWDSLHGKGAWDKNPFVWVLDFKLLT